MAAEVDIRFLSVKDAAKLLRLSAKTVRAHICRGLPTRDGRIDLIAYAAWLNHDTTAKNGTREG